MIQSTKKILVPIDFSEQSLIALEQSYNLAKEYHAEIMLLYVIEEDGVLSKFFSSQQHDDFKKKYQKQLDKLANKVSKENNVVVNTLVTKGKIYDQVAEVADIIGATMIIMGTSGSEGLKKKFIGSNALRVIRESSVPVITIKGKHHRNGCKNIILPLDLTKETREKVSKAVELSKIFHGATIRIVSVILTSDEFIINKLYRQMEQVKIFLEKEEVPCTAEIIKDLKSGESLAQHILEYAYKVEGDLILIMTQQEVDFTDFFVGSSAQEMINNSTIPVMSIIPSPKKDTTVFHPY